MGSSALLAVTWNLGRVLAVVMLAVTVAFLAFAVATCRRPAPVKVRRELLRLGVTAVAIVVMAWITGVSTPVGLVMLAIGVGLLLGALQGWNTKVLRQDGKVLVARAPAGVAAWGAGLVVMQAAGIASRTGALQLGQSISWLGAGVLGGVIVGRGQRLQAGTGAAAAKTAATVLAIFAIGGVVVNGPSRASTEAATAGAWVLVDSEINPTGEAAPVGMDVTTTLTSMTVVRSFGPDDPSGAGAVFEASWTAPPDTLEPGTTLTIPVTVSARHAGNLETQYFLGLDVIMLVDDTWNDQAVGAGVDCVQTTVISGEYVCSDPVTNTGELQTIVPTFGDSFSVGVSALNCSGACWVRWAYEFEAGDATGTTEPAQTDDTEVLPPPAQGPAPEPDPQPDEDPALEPDSGSTDQDDGVGPPPATSTGEPTDDVSGAAAIAQALVGVLAAAAIGLISLGDASALIDSLLGRGPFTPQQAIAQAAGIGSSTAAPVATSPAPPPTGPPPTGPPPGPTRTTTIYVEGTAAERVLADGPGSTVAIPTDQQWDVNVSVGGGKPITDGPVGTTGVVRSVGPVVRGPDGTISIAVEIDASGTPTPPGAGGVPPIEVEPIIDVGEPPEPVGPRPPPPPPVAGVPPIEVEPIIDVGEPPEPVGPRPPPPLDEAPPPPPPPPDEPPPPPPLDDEPVIDEPAGGEHPSDEPPPEGVEPEDAGVVPPDGAEPVVVLDEDEIADIVRWGRERGRSIEDIQADLDWRNAGAGGSGKVPIPEESTPDWPPQLAPDTRPVTVETPNGPVTITAAEAADYQRAQEHLEGLAEAKQAARERMGDLETEMQRWRTWEVASDFRGIAGFADLWQRQADYDAARGVLLDELARLNARPDPMTFDSSRYSSYAEALRDWELRRSGGGLHDRIAQVDSQLSELRTNHQDFLNEASTLGEETRRLDQARGALDIMERGLAPPLREEFPDGGYDQALREWETRDTHGRYFDQMEAVRAHIRSMEASIEHVGEISEQGPVGLDQAGRILEDYGVIEGDQPSVSPVEPAAAGDRGSLYNNPARQLERIARAQERELAGYRRLDDLEEEMRRRVAEIEERAAQN